MITRGRTQQVQVPKRERKQPARELKAKPEQNKQVQKGTRSRRKPASVQKEEPQVVKKVKTSPQLTKEVFLGLLQEKANKNGNIPIKEFKNFMKNLNSDLAEQFFNSLQNDEEVENRKTNIHIFTETEKKDLEQRKQKDLVDDELSDLDVTFIQKSIENQNAFNNFLKDHSFRRSIFQIPLNQEQYRNLLLKKPQLKEIIFKWDYGNFQQELNVFHNALQEIQNEKPQFGQKEGKVIRLTFDFSGSINRWARGSGRRRSRFLRQTFNEQDLLKIDNTTQVFTRLRVLKIKLSNINYAAVQDPLLQFFVNIPKRLVRLMEFECSMNHQTDILLSCLENFEQSETDTKEREYPVNFLLISFTDQKKLERTLINLPSNNELIQINNQENKFQYKINICGDLQILTINQEINDLNKFQILNQKCFQITDLQFEYRINQFSSQMLDKYSQFVKQFNNWPQNCKQLKKLRLKIYSSVKKLLDNFPYILQMENLEEISLNEFFFTNELNEEFQTEPKKKEAAQKNITELLKLNQQNIQFLLSKNLQFYDYQLQSQNNNDLSFSFLLQVHIREKKLTIQLNYICQNYLKYFQQIVEEILEKTQINTLKFQFVYFANSATVLQLLEILSSFYKVIQNRRINLELTINFSEQLTDQHHQLILTLMDAMNEKTEQFTWNMKETSSQFYQQYVLDWLDKIVKLDKVSTVILNFGAKTWSKQKDVKSIVQIAANSKCNIQLDLYYSTFHGMIFDNPIMLQERQNEQFLNTIYYRGFVNCTRQKLLTQDAKSNVISQLCEEEGIKQKIVNEIIQSYYQ